MKPTRAILVAVCLAVSLPSAATADDLLVANWNNGSVIQFDLANGAFIDDIIPSGSGGLSQAHSVAVGTDGNLYVSSHGNDQILLYSGANGSFIDAFVTSGSGGLDRPSSGVFGPDGNLYVGSINQHAVYRYDGVTGAFIDIFVPAGSGGLSGAENLRFGPDDHLYVCSANTDQIKKYDGATGAFIATFASGSMSSPHDLAFRPSDGDLLVANFGGGQPVIEFDGMTGAFERVFVPTGQGITTPHGLDFGPDGNLYVTTFTSSRVYQVEGEDATFVNLFASGNGMSGPTFVAFRSDPTAVASPDPAAPGFSAIRGVYPNPARARHFIDIEIASGAAGDLKIFDATGRLVWTRAIANLATGEHTIEWDGRDLRGQRAPSAVYFIELPTAGGVAREKLIRIE